MKVGTQIKELVEGRAQKLKTMDALIMKSELEKRDFTAVPGFT